MPDAARISGTLPASSHPSQRHKCGHAHRACNGPHVWQRTRKGLLMSGNIHALERIRLKHGDSQRPSRAEVESAVRTIIRWAGDDPHRDGLAETPSRVARAFEEFFAGYAQDPAEILQKTFEEIEGYDEMITLRGIPFESHCEHHMAPIIGQAWVVDAFAKRLQS